MSLVRVGQKMVGQKMIFTCCEHIFCPQMFLPRVHQVGQQCQGSTRPSTRYRVLEASGQVSHLIERHQVVIGIA